MERFEALRRITEQARFGLPGLAPPGGFTVPLTAPLGIPASDLARIAQQVPDPAAANGEATSGTGESPSDQEFSVSINYLFLRNQTEMPILRENLRL